jgi:homeobox protein cut-like
VLNTTQHNSHYLPNSNNMSAPSSAVLKVAVSAWKDVDLDTRRGVIDAQALTIADADDASTSARKHLGDVTKALKRCDDAKKVRAFGGVLRAYQLEVDRLTKRAAFGERAFVDLCKCSCLS